jgi:hypothetical protein
MNRRGRTEDPSEIRCMDPSDRNVERSFTDGRCEAGKGGEDGESPNHRRLEVDAMPVPIDGRGVGSIEV